MGSKNCIRNKYSLLNCKDYLNTKKNWCNSYCNSQNLDVGCETFLNAMCNNNRNSPHNQTVLHTALLRVQCSPPQPHFPLNTVDRPPRLLRPLIHIVQKNNTIHLES